MHSMMSDTAEYKTLIECSDKLISAFQADPFSIADKLLARGFISPALHREALPRALVMSVIKQVELNKKRYYNFLEIVQEELWLEDIKEVICNTYSESY